MNIRHRSTPEVSIVAGRLGVNCRRTNDRGGSRSTAQRPQARWRLRRVDLDAEDLPREDPAEDILSLDQALQRLAILDERLERVVELRFFGGLSVEETAEALEVNPRTVKRDWRKARALLYRELGRERVIRPQAAWRFHLAPIVSATRRASRPMP